MARRPPRSRTRPKSETKPNPDVSAPEAPSRSFWTPLRLALAVVALLAIHWTLAVLSLVRENPTVDEVAHLPAGITYWQTGSFRLYPHNPPLIKLMAALPVLQAGPVTAPLYGNLSWTRNPPVHASVAHEFAVLNAPQYFELFQRGRLVMPWFSVLGGLVVFAWSRRLYGAWGGLLSLTLWTFCPNILAHARLVTTDVGATALGVGATFLFWLHLHQPSWARAAVAGIALGLAALSKFSTLLLYALWPLLWLVHEVARGKGSAVGSVQRTDGIDANRIGALRTPYKRILRALRQGAVIVLTSVLVINLGYGFEGTGQPLGRFDFSSGVLTKPRVPAAVEPGQGNDLAEIVRPFRVNRFRGSVLERLPAPLPRYYLLGFDLQKLEAEGIPLRFFNPAASPDQWTGYPVYLDGELQRSGWWYYYLLALAYKVPEGTWLLGLLSLVVMAFSARARAPWADEVAVAAVPVVVLAAMSFGTDINLGLRYILPAFPYAFIATGKLAPWAAGFRGRRRWGAAGVVVGGLALTAAATLAIHPHYLAYFNWASGGADRGSEHLIDSNLDWGQDLVNLRDWLHRHAPGEAVGLAYFGQVNPNLLRLRGAGFDWFLPPAAPGTLEPMRPYLDGPAPRLEPGRLYAVSASLVRGLPWRLYDSSLQVPYLYPAWKAERDWQNGRDAFGYFRELTPIARVGHSIFLYRPDARDVARVERLLDGPAGQARAPEALLRGGASVPRQ